MVHWDATEKQTITSFWGKVDLAADGEHSLQRLLYVYPWCRRYFHKFGDLSTISAIRKNSHVRAHGHKVLSALGDCVPHLGDIKGHLAQLSKLHCETLHVDPANFCLLGQIITIVLASRFGAAFTPEVQACFEKLVGVTAAGLSSQYH